MDRASTATVDAPDRGLLLLCGPANSGKVRAILDEFVHACRRDGGAWLVVPTLGDVRRAREELAARERVLLGGRIGTFHHLVREFARGPEDEVEAAVETVVVRWLLEGSRVLAPALAYPGFVSLAARRLRELRSAAAAGDAEFVRRLEALPAGERGAWRRLVEQSGPVFDQAGLRDAAWHEQRAVRALETGLVRPVPVLAYGFDDLTATQQRLLGAAARRTRVILSLPFVPGRPVFERRQRMVDRLMSAGARIEVSGEAAFDHDGLAQLEARFGEPTADPCSCVEGIRFVECCGDLQQAEEIAREVGRLLVAGTPADEIAVLGTDVSRLRPLLEPVLRRSGVSAVFDSGRTVAETPAGRAVLDVLDAVLHDDPLAVIAWARSRVSPVPPPEVDSWEQRLLPLLQDGVPRPPGWWSQICAVPGEIRQLVRAAASHRRSIVPAVRAVLHILVPTTQGDVRLLAALERILDSLERLDALRATGLQAVRDALASLPIPPASEREVGAVVVAPVTRVRTDRFDAVILVGLHSGGFAAGGDVDESEAPLVARELAYIGFTRARSSVTFVRQAASSDGRVRAPHPVWQELRRLAPGAQLQRRGLDEVARAPHRVTLASELLPSVALAVGEGSLDPAWLAPELAEPLAALAVDPRETTVGQGWREIVAARGELSVSDIEEYASCPARWFTRRHLLPRDPAGPTSRQVVGTLVHHALAELVPKLVDDADRPIGEVEIEQAVENGVGTLPRGARIRTLDRSAAVLAARRLLAGEHVHGARSLSELEFGGPDESLPALEVAGMRLRGRIDRVDVAADGAAVVHDYKLASSAVAGLKLVEEGKLQLPLYWEALRRSGTYDPVAAVYRPLEGARPRGLVHGDTGPVFEGGYRTDRLDEETIDAVIDDALREAGRAVRGILAGDVAASPRGGSCPDWCDVAAICRVEGR